MRLWSIHPQYLDKYGLIALWREGLLAQKVLNGGAQGYRNNPQLTRFKNTGNPLRSIGSYLSIIASEGARQGYRLNHEKIMYPNFEEEIMPVSKEQFDFEVKHLKAKLKIRDKSKYRDLEQAGNVKANPIFTLQ